MKTTCVFNKRTCTTLAVCVSMLTLVLWYMVGGGEGTGHSVRWGEDRQKLAAIRKSHNFYIDNEQSLSNSYMSEFSFEKFSARRKAKLAEIQAKKTRKGDLHVYKPIRVVPKSNCVPFKTMTKRTRLCVHSKEFDPFISSHIRDLGTWEEDYLVAMATALKMYPDMHVVDIGCNVGTYTFYAALLGRRVVALDPIRTNLFMLHSSLKYAGLRDNVVLLLNAISEYAEPVRVILNKENIGGSSIEPVSGSYSGTDAIVNCVVMDDLIRVVDFQKVFLKIDIEAHEWKALHRASDFFRKLDVRYVLMEWIFYKHNVAGHEIIDFFHTRGYLPFQDVLQKTPLKVKEHHLWPENVFWCKQ